nr:hypothetical protein [Halomicronema hongdechloris]
MPHDQAGRPAQGQSPSHYSYHLQAEVVPFPQAIATVSTVSLVKQQPWPNSGKSRRRSTCPS